MQMLQRYLYIDADCERSLFIVLFKIRIRKSLRTNRTFHFTALLFKRELSDLSENRVNATLSRVCLCHEMIKWNNSKTV